jgi:4-diphosphocytidyl-2-C-methyl-D-erythritol kinase
MLTQAHAVVIRAPAKVNLFLEVLAKRPDGYHDIATLLVAVDLYDELEFTEEPSGEVRLTSDHPQLSCGPDNLIRRAADLLRRHTGCPRGAAIRLSKRIPLAAGLAGGSTDAAAALAGLNDLWRLGLARDELAALGAGLGSDVPFFFATAPSPQPSPPGGEGGVRGPAAWCTGRGEVVTPLALGRPLTFVLVCPPVGLSTADVYRGVQVPAQPLAGEEIRRAVAAGDVEVVGRRLHNRLQPVAERLCPSVAEYRRRLEQLRPAGQLMSGSGSSLFALCRDDAEAGRVAHELRHESDGEARPLVCLVRSCF